KNVLSLLVILGIAGVSCANVNFDDLTLGTDSYWNGADGSGSFVSGSVSFNNVCMPEYNYWEGWAYSNVTNNTTPGLENQYSAITGSAHSGSNYGIAFMMFGVPIMTLNESAVVEGFYVTNTTYAYLAMLKGINQGRAFTEDDWFKLTITGFNKLNVRVGTVDFFLASEGNIVNSWEFVDLTSLGMVKSLQFSLTSTDVGGGGINTPTYFAMDTLIVPEPATIAMLCIGGLLLGRKGR
ncbi:MAG: DUF4465 domain-containing protein, partial [Phycisphaerales bacterium]